MERSAGRRCRSGSPRRTRARGTTPTSGGSGGHDDGSTTWNANLEPAFADDARSLRLTPVPPPHRRMPGTAATALGGPVDLALPAWPPQPRTVPATVAPAALVVRSPLAGHHAGLRGRPRTGPPGRVVPVNTRLDTGRSDDPALMSVEVWPEHFELHLTWDAYVTLGELMGTGWRARDDLGHHYHGVACNGHGGAVASLSLVFAPVLAPGARKLTLTLPDLVSTPVTRAGALHATVALRPDRG